MQGLAATCLLLCLLLHPPLSPHPHLQFTPSSHPPFAFGGPKLVGEASTEGPRERLFEDVAQEHGWTSPADLGLTPLLCSLLSSTTDPPPLPASPGVEEGEEEAGTSLFLPPSPLPSLPPPKTQPGGGHFSLGTGMGMVLSKAFPLFTKSRIIRKWESEDGECSSIPQEASSRDPGVWSCGLGDPVVHSRRACP